MIRAGEACFQQQSLFFVPAKLDAINRSDRGLIKQSDGQRRQAHGGLPVRCFEGRDRRPGEEGEAVRLAAQGWLDRAVRHVPQDPAAQPHELRHERPLHDRAGFIAEALPQDAQPQAACMNSASLPLDKQTADHCCVKSHCMLKHTADLIGSGTPI